MTKKKNFYQTLKEKGLIGFLANECDEKGCRNLETRCLDCGRVVNTDIGCDPTGSEVIVKGTAQFGAINCTPVQSGDGWIRDRKPIKEDSPILAYQKHPYDDDRFTVAALEWSVEDDRWYDHSLEYGMEERHIKYWMPLPKPPKDNS